MNHDFWPKVQEQASERAQELQKGFSFTGLQLFKFFGDVSSLAAVAGDGVQKCQRGTVVHQSRSQADSPQRSGAYLVAGALEILFREIVGHLLEDLVTVVFASGLQDSVASVDVVHEEVAPRMKGDGAERGWNAESAAIDLGSRGSGGQCCDMAGHATDLLKKSEAFLRSCAAGELSIAGGRFRRANEAGEMIDMLEAVRAWFVVVRLSNGIAKIGHLIGLKAVCDAHLVEIRVATER